MHAVGVLAVVVVLAGCTASPGEVVDVATPTAPPETTSIDDRYFKFDMMYPASPVERPLLEMARARGLSPLRTTSYFAGERLRSVTDPYSRVASGEFDASTSHHLAALATFNVTAAEPLVAVATTYLNTMGLYATGVEDVADLPEGAVVAVPDDPANHGRELLLLEAAGLVTLREGVGAFATAEDIVDNPKQIELNQVGIMQVTGIGNVDARVAYAVEFDVLSDQVPLLAEDPTDPRLAPYWYAVVVHPALADDPRVAELAAIYHDPELAEAKVEHVGHERMVLVDRPAAEIAALLAELEAEYLRVYGGSL